MNPDFWHIQLHSDKKLSVKQIRQILTVKSVIGMATSWKNKNGKEVADPIQFKEEMKVGDIVLVRSGRQPIALVQLKSDAFITENTHSDLDWFGLRRKIEILSFFDSSAEEILQKSLTSYNKKYIQALGTLTRCVRPSATREFIENWWRSTTGKTL